MSFKFNIPSIINSKNCNLQYSLDKGETITFVGSNGSGKTRLTVHIENELGIKAHRISAHRALTLNLDVTRVREKDALALLRQGIVSQDFQVDNRIDQRWRYKSATHLLNDYDFVIQALFAEHSNVAINVYKSALSGSPISKSEIKPSKMESLVQLWNEILPHRKLELNTDDLTVSGIMFERNYDASDMSDGERAIFYLIGQVLLAQENSLLIFDEPELHIHKSILSKLWDKLITLRSDCGYIFITHDLEFAATRNGKKYVVRNYLPNPSWEISEVPDESDFGEEISTLILGSRKPVLFVEGTQNSLDFSVYRACYPNWTVIPRSSCSEVIHAVSTLRKSEDLTRITCSGIVDLDDHQSDEIEYLSEIGVHVLPVAEIENIFLLPEIVSIMAKYEGYDKQGIKRLLKETEKEIIDSISEKMVKNAVIRFCKRRVYREIKNIDFSKSKSFKGIQNTITSKMNDINITALADSRGRLIEDALVNSDLAEVLIYIDNKGLLEILSRKLKRRKKNDFLDWIKRIISSDTCPGLIDEVTRILPQIDVK